MSRCFPYPPPGYCRNGAAHQALIESIKLQKETDKAKADRKKEKRAKKEKKEKKKEEKEKRKTDEKLKLQKNQSQDSQKLQKQAGFTQAQINGTKPTTELLEKSDLTQENGQPIKPCYSSDSTQNSNKRRRDNMDDDDLLPDDSTGHGKHIKIRLLKKHRGSDSSNSAEDARSNRSIVVPETSVRENNAVLGIPLTQTKSNTHFERITERNPIGSHLGASAKPTLPSGSRKSDVESLKSNTQQQQQNKQQIARFVRPVVSQSHLKHAAPPTLSNDSRYVGVQGLNSARHHQQGPSTLNPVLPGPVLNKPSPITTGKRPISDITVASNSRPAKLEKNEITTGKRPISEITVPSTSKPAKLEKNEEPKKTGPTRAEKKMMKKKAKYEKLIGGWVPSGFQALLPPVEEDEDWLSRAKPASLSTSRGEVESCHELAASSMWQPRARLLVEADVYALPYTVPF